MKEGTLISFASRAGSGTLLSRILGYIRDMVIAARFGAGAWADAFYVALRVPNLLRNLLGEGTLGTSFIPVFSEYLSRDEEEAWNLAGIIFSVLAVLLGCLVLLGVAFAPVIVRLIAPGFLHNPEKLALTTTLTRIMFPFLFFISLAALSTAVLNSMRSFFIPAVAPAMLSAGEICSVFFIVPFMGGSIKGLAIGVLLGGIGQLLAQLPQVLKFWPRGKSRFMLALSHPGVKKIFRLMLPATVGIGIYQISIFVDTICASFLVQGSPTALYYANRLMQLPLAIFGTSIATVALPQMSTYAADRDMDGLLRTFSSGLRMILFLIMPAAAGLIFLGRPIIAVLFQRGMFDRYATGLTYRALLFYSLGLISYAGIKITASAFYSMQDTKTPLRISIIAILLNINLNLILMWRMGVGGLALATAISSSLNFFLLLSALRRRTGTLQGLRVLDMLWHAGITTGAVGITCYYINMADISPFVKVGAGIPISVFLVFALAFLFRMEEGKAVRALIFKKKNK